jgi:hypothetical protein
LILVAAYAARQLIGERFAGLTLSSELDLSGLVHDIDRRVDQLGRVVGQPADG